MFMQPLPRPFLVIEVTLSRTTQALLLEIIEGEKLFEQIYNVLYQLS